jgi:indole-3-glycerol phosphate synthase
METILDRIIFEKQKEVQRLKEIEQPVLPSYFPTISLLERLENATTLAVIAEFKRASPSKGIINNDIEPADQAVLYEKNGATAISVLTDNTFFKGSFQDLQAVRAAVNLPILCKDFIIDRIQIDYAKKHGANIILLIAAALHLTQLKKLYEYGISIGLEVLVEIHDEEDLEKTLTVQPKLIGINNRNLKTFEVNLEVTERLAPHIRSSGSFMISESGIFTSKDALRVKDAGVNGVLVGEALMKSDDLKESFTSLRVPF